MCARFALGFSACQSVLLLICACFALGFAACRAASFKVLVATGAYQGNHGKQDITLAGEGK